ncbi:hypothetical protein J4410_03035, partial [Candidatus Woesearchaeota archaeon]|nr:hypothetical protein [Candidatus Woesearchaeota archaeon]
MALNYQKTLAWAFLVLALALFSPAVQAQTIEQFICADNQLLGDVRPVNPLSTSTPLVQGIHDAADAELLADLAVSLYIPDLIDQYGLPGTCQCLDPNQDGSTTILDSLLVGRATQGLVNLTQRCPVLATPPLNATLCLPGSVLGDVDGNGSVSIIDARIAAEIAVGTRAPPVTLCCIDANPIGAPNGVVDILDALAIAQNVSGLISLIGPGCPLLPPAQPNLSIDKTAAVLTAVPGDTVQYTITVTN